MVSIKGSDSAGAPCLDSVVPGVKPDAEVEHVHRGEYWVQTGIRERSMSVHDRRRPAARGMGERLVAEYTGEPAAASPAFVGLDITLIPSDAKRRFRKLEHKDGEGRVGGTALHRHIHVLVRPGCADTHVGARDRKSTRLNSSHANISYAVF